MTRTDDPDLVDSIFPDGVRELVTTVDETHDIRIDRRTQWGNPYRLEDCNGILRCGIEFIAWLSSTLPTWCDVDRAKACRAELDSLDGQTLACHCAPHLCHGHILATVAGAKWSRERTLKALYERLHRLDTFPGWMRRKRKASGVPLRKIADHCDVEHTRLSKIERREAIPRPGEVDAVMTVMDPGDEIDWMEVDQPMEAL